MLQHFLSCRVYLGSFYKVLRDFNVLKKQLEKGFLQVVIICVLLQTKLVFAETIHDNLLKASNTMANAEYMRARFLSLMKVPFDKSDQRKKALIIGDSYAQDFYNSIFEGHHLKNYQISTRYIPVRCQIFLGNESNRKIEVKDRDFCNQADSLNKAKQQISEADLIILGASWKAWSAKKLAQSIKNMDLNSQQKIIVIGKKSYGRITINDYLSMQDSQLKQLRNRVNTGQMEINQTLKETLGIDVFVDQHEMICGKTETCPLFTDKMELISFDGGHLTKEGAQYVGRILFENPILKNL